MSETRTGRALPQVVLPPGARFTCQQCGDCCRSFPVSLTDEETLAFEARDWSPVLPGHVGPVFDEVSTGPGKRARFLRRRPGGACVFLDEARNLCRIHGALGEAAKPLACRLFPFTASPGDASDPRPRVGCHFACKALAAGDGAEVAGQRRALEALVAELSSVHDLSPRSDPLAWDRARSYDREELEVTAALVTSELEDASRPFPDRFLAVVKFLDLFARSSFAEVKDARRKVLVEKLAQGVREQVKRGLLRPGGGEARFAERLLFRQIVAMSVRRDPPDVVTANPLRRGSRRISGFLGGLAFSAGGGSFVPTGRSQRVRVSEVRRRAPEADPASPEADGALTRYFVAHMASRRLFDRGFQPGEVLAAYGLLLRQYPAILLFARAACLARGGDALTRDDYASALRTADWTFGHIPWTTMVSGSSRRFLLADLEAPFRHLAWCAKRPV